MTGKFQKNKVNYISINGNSKMKYFDDKQKNKSIIGINDIEAGNIKLIFKGNGIKEIICFDQIESNYIEIDLIHNSKKQDESINLDGFILINRFYS